MNYDHILFIGFGSPASAGEIEPFLQEVSRQKRIPASRLQKVQSQYEKLGGSSPYTKEVSDFARRFEECLFSDGNPLPVFVGMRHWHPFLKDTLGRIERRGLQRGFAFILSPFRSPVSFDAYLGSLEEAGRDCGPGISYEVPLPWHDHPLFIKAWVDQILKTEQERLESKRGAECLLLFSAHSIPQTMARRCRYREDILSSAGEVARQIGIREWKLAFQSRSGDARETWLGPDVLEIAHSLEGGPKKNVLVVPIGFLCENAEIAFDLDVSLKEELERGGHRYRRVPMVMGSPHSLELVKSLVSRSPAPL